MYGPDIDGTGMLIFLGILLLAGALLGKGCGCAYTYVSDHVDVEVH